MADKEEKEELRCVWNLGGPCTGEVKMLQMFNKSIEIPVCDGHTDDHRTIMTLHHNKYDIEEVLKMTAEKRKEEMLILKLSGLLKEEDVVL